MKLNFSFKTHFKSKFYVYLLVVCIIPLLLCFSIQLKTNPSKKEKISFLIGADLKPDSLLTENIGNALSDYSNKEINIFAMDAENPNFVSVYATQILSTDFFVLPKDFAKTINQNDFFEFSGDEGFCSENDFINDRSMHVGLKINDFFKTDISYKETDYFLFIKSNSVHLGSYYSKSMDNQFETLLRYL